jgi:uracil-DNA glycosylase family 4
MPLTASTATRTDTDTDADARFADLVARVQACRACPRMEGRRRVLGAASGRLRPTAMLVGTAPGRHGAERTGIPFSGDRSGAALDELLQRAGLNRADVFITNAVLCNPQDAHGRNDEPSAVELRNCGRHLARTIEVVDPPLLVALGRTAYAALCRLQRGARPWHDALGSAQHWHGRLLAATYHPGPRVWMQPLRRAALLAQWDALFSPSAAPPR